MMIIKGKGGEGKVDRVVLNAIFGCNMKDGSIGKVSKTDSPVPTLSINFMIDDDMKWRR